MHQNRSRTPSACILKRHFFFQEPDLPVGWRFFQSGVDPTSPAWSQSDLFFCQPSPPSRGSGWWFKGRQGEPTAGGGVGGGLHPAHPRPPRRAAVPARAVREGRTFFFSFLFFPLIVREPTPPFPLGPGSLGPEVEFLGARTFERPGTHFFERLGWVEHALKSSVFPGIDAV